MHVDPLMKHLIKQLFPGQFYSKIERFFAPLFVAGLPLIVSTLMQLYFASKFAPEKMGVAAALLISINAIVAITNLFGDKFLIYKNDESLLLPINILEISAGIIFFLIFVFSLSLISKEYSDFIINEKIFYLFAFLFFYNALVHRRAILEIKGELIRAHMATFLAHIAAALLGISFFYMQGGIESILIWRLSTFPFEVAFVFIFTLKRRFKSPVKGYSIEFLKFSLPLTLAACVGFATLNFDNLIIISYLQSEDLAFYWLAFSLSHVLISLREIVIKIIYPRLAAQDCREKKIQYFENVLALSQIAILPTGIFVLILSSEVLELFLGTEWKAVNLIFNLLFIAAMVKFVSGFYYPLILAFGKTGFNLKVAVFSGLILLPAVFFSIVWSGLIGLSLSIISCSIFILIFCYVFGVRTVTDGPVWHYFKLFFAVIISYVLLCFLLNLPQLDVTLFSKIIFIALWGLILNRLWKRDPFLGSMSLSERLASL